MNRPQQGFPPVLDKRGPPRVRRFDEQRWLIDNIIRANGIDWDQPRSLYIHLPCGIEANAAKYLAAEAGFTACETAVLTHGGMGYAKEFHVERLLREVLIARIAPVSRELILCNIAEKALGLPKSY